ncbi:TRAP transporter small permease [Algicella marina]|uniref:TRAP transporter small permease protein n=1 Tax=Algicella marina TaxID=2683284 RepID=A0A6P1SZU4_9RHOB|nr:TRAP transporter small permease [Algicella marina]QHQ34981.1 TRAP transporter small permease subunit [Algicella marina]
MSSHDEEHEGWWARTSNAFERTAIAAMLGIMTLITCINVFFRKTFDWAPVNWLEAKLGFIWPDNIDWGYQTTLILFSWLVLFGMGYAVRKRSHLGVDVILNLCNRPGRKLLGLVSVFLCIAYAFLVAKGSWDYFSSFVNLPATTGHWFPTGLSEMTFRNRQAFYTFDEIDMPSWLLWMEGVFGEEYDKLPRAVGYVMLPIGSFLLLGAFIRAAIRIWKNREDRLIVSHEAEDDVAAVALNAER